VRRTRLFWQILPVHLGVAWLAIAIGAVVATHVVRRFHYEQRAATLETQAFLMAPRVAAHLDRAPDGAAIDSLCDELAREAGVRVTVILPSGQVVGDSEENPAAMEPHLSAERIEILAAREGRVSRSQRYSWTLHRSMLYVAVPIHGAGDAGANVIGVLRAAVPVSALVEALRAARARIVTAAVLIGLLVLLSYLALAGRLERRVARPLGEIARGAEAIGAGATARPLPTTRVTEVDALAGAVTTMAARLDERLHRITAERNELEAILGSMTEGVLAIGADGRVAGVNPAAGRMLGIEPTTAQGRRIEEVLRNPALQRLVEQGPEGGAIRGEVELYRGDEVRRVHVSGAPWRDTAGQPAGAVLVLNDVTTLRRLERLRRDFVANVSHELKTPITAIQGAVETLQEEGFGSSSDATRFLAIIERQAARLNRILEDLLHLSRIERGTERNEIVLVEDRLRPVLEAALEACAVRADERHVRIDLDCPPELQARIHAELLENAVVNLIDNAIKYSEPDSVVRVSAEAEADVAVIAVRDEGCGIDPRHHNRIFERFYRVDPARSRAAGGTGLGLAIVKHIVQAHGGSVAVESALGEGSVFRIRLPLR